MATLPPCAAALDVQPRVAPSRAARRRLRARRVAVRHAHLHSLSLRHWLAGGEEHLARIQHDDPGPDGADRPVPARRGDRIAHCSNDGFEAHDGIQSTAKDSDLPVKSDTPLDKHESESIKHTSILGNAFAQCCDDGFGALDATQCTVEDSYLPVKSDTPLDEHESESIKQTCILGGAFAHCCDDGFEAHDAVQCTAKDSDLTVKSDIPRGRHESESINHTCILGNTFAQCSDDGFEALDAIQCTAKDSDLTVKSDIPRDRHESESIKQASILGNAFAQCSDDALWTHYDALAKQLQDAGRPWLKAVGMPNREECEKGVAVLMRGSFEDLKVGLLTLHLPAFPMVKFGHSLQVEGLESREEIDEIIDAWQNERKEDFYKALLKFRQLRGAS